jgi:hypothetical protein
LTTVGINPEEVVNQTAIYLAFLISLASAGAIGIQVYRGLTKRIRKGREESEARSDFQHAETKKYVDDKMREVNEIKDRVEYMYRKMIDKYLNNNKSDVKDK